MFKLFNPWQHHPLLKIGVLGISLLCYALLMLHPFLAHATPNLSSAPGQSAAHISQSAPSAGGGAAQIAKAKTSPNDCPLCRQISGNPTALLSAPVLLVHQPLAYLSKPFAAFLLSKQAVANQDSRGPPAKTA